MKTNDAFLEDDELLTYSFFGIPLFDYDFEESPVFYPDHSAHYMVSKWKFQFMRDKEHYDVVMHLNGTFSLINWEKNDEDEWDFEYVPDWTNKSLLDIPEFRKELQEKINVSDQVPNVQETLVYIKASFGLSTDELATILNIDRKQLYDLYRSNVQLGNNLARLVELTALAKDWRLLCKLPAKNVLKIKIDGTTLFDELCKVPYDTEKIQQLLTHCAAIINSVEEQRKQSGSIYELLYQKCSDIKSLTK